MIYKAVPNIEELECTSEGSFRLNGKSKKVIFPHVVDGRKATARIVIMKNGKSHYYQASKLVALTWKIGYKDGDYLSYKDGDCHNISADNLIINDKDGYYSYMRRNSIHSAADVEERKRKLKIVIDEATMTLNYFESLDMSEINKHVNEYLYKCLMDYSIRTLHMGERQSLEQVPEALARMYECIMNGMCLYNYERYCKKLLLNFKKKGSFGLTGKVPKPIKIEVQQLNLDSLWERYKVTKLKQK